MGLAAARRLTSSGQCLGVFIWNLLLWSGEILWLTLLGLTVPNHIRGRVNSIDFLGWYWMIPLSMALTGPIAALIGPRTVLVWTGIGGQQFSRRS